MAKFDPKAKAKRQRIIAGVLGLVLVGVLVFQAPKILSMFGGGSTAASEPAPATPAPATIPPVAGVAVAGAPVAAPAAGTAELVDSDPALAPADGQLVSFDRFESKDPFAPQVSDALAGAAAAAPTVAVDAGSKSEDPGGDASQPAPDVRDAPAPVSAAPSTASISVNGDAQDVKVGATFPESDPIFKLVSLKGDTIRIGIVGGGYANGSQTVTMKEGGKPVTLMNTADGTTYVLRLVSVG